MKDIVPWSIRNLFPSEHDEPVKFKASSALGILLARDKYPFGVRAVVRAGFCTWVIAPYDVPLIQDSMRLRTAALVDYLELKYNRKLKDRKSHASMVDALVRFLPNYKSLFHEFYHPLGSMQGISNTVALDRHSSKISSEGNKADVTVLVVGVLRYHALKLGPYGKPYGRPSVSKACDAAGAITRPAIDGRTVLKNYWKPRRQSAAWIYAASTITVSNGESLLDRINSGRNRRADIDPWLQKLAGSARFASEILLGLQLAGFRGQTEFFDFDSNIEVCAIGPPEFSHAQLADITEHCKDKRF